MFRSVQKLEQETVTYGGNIYSIDGREWLRVRTDNTNPLEYSDQTTGRINLVTSNVCFFEIVGYFNDANLLLEASTASLFSVYLNGGSAESNTAADVSIATPLGGRYVDSSSLINLVFDTTPTLGINTIKILKIGGNNVYATGIELIAQDTGSDVRKNHVNVPAQNVVSYGKKFSIGSDTLTNAVHKHYNPFAFKTD